jgi:tagatose 6-phosphate kinase
MLPLLCVGPTPALQRSLRFPTWDSPSDVVRTNDVQLSVGGKATNAARAILRNGGTASLISFAGGLSGERMKQLLRDEGIDAVWVETAAESRCCQTLLDAGGHRIRELVEDAAPVSPGEWGELYAAVERALPFHAGLLLCGSLPLNSPSGAYAGLVRLAREAHRPCLIDAKGAELLASLPEKPAWVKINRGELLASTGRPFVPQALQELLQLGAAGAFITDGPEQALLALPRKTWTFQLPAIDPVNPIGGGDTVAGVFLSEWLRSSDPISAAQKALAAGLAQTLTERPADFDPREAASFSEKIKIAQFREKGVE